MDTSTAAPDKGQPNSATRIWQHAILAYADSIPELGAISMYVGNCLSRIELSGAKRNLDGTIGERFDGAEPVEGVDPEIAAWTAEILAGLRCARGGRPELLRRYGEQMFLVGEMYLLLDDGPAGMTTEVLSIEELIRDGKGWKRIGGDGTPDETLADATPIRVWRPSRRFTRLASSSVKSCLTILDELDILTRLVKASAICRLALSGILALPDELDSPLDEAGPDSIELTNPLVVDIINQACKAIDDPSSAAAFVPYILQGPADMLQHVRLIAFTASDSIHIVQRAEAIQRLASGLDSQMEAVTGHNMTTFANSKQISEDEYKIHIEPSCIMLADAVMEAILWPGLAKKLGLSPERVAASGYPPEILAAGVHYDASALVSHPDKTKDIIQAWKDDPSQCAVAIEELRMALDLDPDGGPDDDEIAKRIDAIRLTKIREQILAPAADAAVPIADAATKAPKAGASAGQDLIGADAKAAEAAPAGATAAQADATVTGSGLPHVSGLAWLVAGAADMTIERCAERTGARVRAKVGKGTSEADAIDGQPNSDVVSILGPDVVSRVLGREDQIGAEVASFAKLVARMSRQAGHPHPGLVADGMAKLVAASARDRLYGVDVPVTAEMCEPLLVGV